MLSTACSTFKKIATGALLCAGLTITSSQVQATPLNLILSDSPDIISSWIDVSYNANNEALTMSGYALELFDGTASHQIANGTFALSANVSNSGVLSGGSLTIGGTIAALGFSTSNLLTGSLFALGFDDSTSANNQTLEFRFDTTDGDAALLYTNTGSSGGILVHLTGFNGDWGSDWSSNPFAAVSDVGVPAPTALWLIAAGIGLFGVARRYRTQA